MSNNDKREHRANSKLPVKLAPSKYALSLALGLAIIGGIFVANEQISALLRNNVDENKQVAIDSFHKLADRKERRLSTLSAGIIAFYKTSENASEPGSFRRFVQEITQATPDLRSISVEEDGKIIQSYPEASDVGIDANTPYGTPNFLGTSGLQHYLLFQFPIKQTPNDDRIVVIGVEPSFFVDPDEILGDNYRANLAVSAGNHEAEAIIYQESEIGNVLEKKYYDFSEFSAQELENSIKVTVEGLQGRGTSDMVIINYQVWDSSFEVHTIPFQYVNIVIGSIAAAAVTILLTRSQMLGEKLRQYIAKLEESDKFKNNFINLASHELKTPIQPILIYSEMGRRGQVNSDKAFDVIHSQAKRLKALADEILDLSKIEEGTLSYEMAKVDIKSLLSNVAETARLSITDPLVLQIRLESDESVGVLHGDANRLSQALQILLSNAIKFTPKGTITIASSLKGNNQSAEGKSQFNNLEIGVKDTGLGIPHEMMPRLFSKFATSDVDGRNKSGTGLGLFIAKAIVEAHGGQIIGENNPDGIGARFQITLPIRDSNYIPPVACANRSIGQ